MFCGNCGYKREKNDKFCERCGQKFEDKSNNKIISILGFILSFILPLIGIILSIIAFIKGNKNEKENNIKNKYLGLNIAGFILGIILSIIYFILFIALIIYFSMESDDNLIGNYECSRTFSFYSNSNVHLNLNKDKTFSLVTDLKNNYVNGNYSYQKISSNNNQEVYTLNFNIKNYVSNGVGKELESNEKTTTSKIYKNKSDDSMIFVTGGNYFTCQKENSK